jgi:fatty-acyl-CoA synthase
VADAALFLDALEKSAGSPVSERHFRIWPKGLPRTLVYPETSLYYNLEVASTRWPGKPYIVFYDTPLTFREFRRDAEHLAGWLQQRCGVGKGDRVIVYLQNSPQYMLGVYGALRADAVAVPVSPMNLVEELRQYAANSGARVAIVGQELLERIAPLLGSELDHLIVAAYSDYVTRPTDLNLPEAVAALRANLALPGAVTWNVVMASGLTPAPHTAGPDDLALLPYTSGTTGHPKGCMHTHRTVMTTAVGSGIWYGVRPLSTILCSLPLFHVAAMQSGMNGPMFWGQTVVLLQRWDRDTAARLIERYRVGSWGSISTMAIDFLANPDLARHDLSSLGRIGGGGAAMPEAVAARLRELTGLEYIEGYGLTETMAPSHINPTDAPKRQCLGIPIFGVDSRIVDPQTLRELPPGESGEILIHGPQVFLGYWNDARATAEAFVEIEGKRFFRTGDLARCDEEGYFFMTDRLKRMINASGMKVWPAEVEAMMHAHPDILEACIIAARDAYRGESVKAVVVLKAGRRGQVTAEDIIAWCRGHMAAFKVPRSVEIADSLPKSATGKVEWRLLQEREG